MKKQLKQVQEFNKDFGIKDYFPPNIKAILEL